MNVPANYNVNLLQNLGSMGVDNIWALKGDLHVLKYYLMRQASDPDQTLLDNVDILMEISNELYQFFINLKSTVSQADFNKLARTLDAGGNVIQALEEIITTRKVDLKLLLRNGFSVLLQYGADTAYISSAMEGCEALVSTNAVIVYDRYWALVQKYRYDATREDIENIKTEMDKFFGMLSNRNISLPDRITLTTRLYQFLCIIYVTTIMNNLNKE
jgi:hypothetical protein